MKTRGLSLIAVFCIGVIAWINFSDLKIPEIHTGYGSKFEKIAEVLAFSYLGSYIFYMLNIYLVERQEKKSILPFIAGKVIGIVVNNHSIINCLKNNPKVDLTYYPTKYEFKNLLQNVNPHNKSPLYYKNESWIYLFKNRQKSTKNAINVIFQSGSKHIDEELRRILLEIDNSLYLKEEYAFNSDDFQYSSLEKYDLVFFKYFELILKLNTYYNKHLKKYYLIKEFN